MAVARVQEELRALHGVDEIAGDVEIAPVVGVHGVDLERKARGPPAPELGRGYAAAFGIGVTRSLLSWWLDARPVQIAERVRRDRQAS
jgi:hypothetical protein